VTGALRVVALRGKRRSIQLPVMSSEKEMSFVAGGTRGGRVGEGSSHVRKENLVAGSQKKKLQEEGGSWCKEIYLSRKLVESPREERPSGAPLASGTYGEKPFPLFEKKSCS